MHGFFTSMTSDGVSAFGNLLTGIAAAAAAYQAIKSLSAWQAETVGRRRIQVAEEVLTIFYTIQDIIFQSRAPMVFGGERGPEEGVDESVTNDGDYAPYRRLARQQHAISELRTKRHVFAALFGKGSTKPFDDMEIIIREIRTAVEERIDMKRSQGPPKKGDPDFDFYQDLKWVIFRQADARKDVITPRVEMAVKEIEAICGPVIQARR